MRRDEVIYSAQKRDFIKGRRYMNPRHFSGPVNDAASVIIVGKWDNIVDAYRMQAADVKLTVVADLRELSALFERRASGKPDMPSPQTRKPRAKAADQSAAEITLPAFEEMSGLAFPALRKLATQLSEDEITSREQALAIVEQERARRAAA